MLRCGDALHYSVQARPATSPPHRTTSAVCIASTGDQREPKQQACIRKSWRVWGALASKETGKR